MPQIYIKVASMNKKKGSWTGTFLTPIGRGTKDFGANNIDAGSRLKQILDSLDAQGASWPWGDGITESGEDFVVSYNQVDTGFEKFTLISSVEMTVQAYQLALRRINPTAYKGQKDAKDDLKNYYSSKLSNYNLIWEHLPGNRDYIFTGKAKVIDGDTLEVKIETLGQGLTVSQDFRIGNLVRVRFVGVDTPETRKDFADGSSDADERNNIIAKKYKISLEQAYEMGAAAKKVTADIMSIANGTVIVDVDIANGQLVQTYGRYVGMVYKTPYDSSVMSDPMTPDDWYINMNKTLIATPSVYKYINEYGTEQNIPVASVSRTFDQMMTGTKFDVYSWNNTVAYHAAENLKQMEEEDQKMQDEARQAIQDEINHFRYNNEKTISNTEQYVVQPGDTLQKIIDEYKLRGDSITKETIIAANDLQKDDKGNIILNPGDVLIIPIVTIDPDTNVINAPDGDSTYRNGDFNYVDNKLNFFAPIDDRRSMTSKYHMRIGDVQFIIPPLSITSTSVSNLQKVHTLRTKSSMITKSGDTVQALKLQLYFHDIDTINGYKVQVADGLTYYMDGLRSLIAEFKKSPFLPIENEFVNEVLNIHDVILAGLNVTTVPGFPHSLAATLTLAEFDHTAYMPQVEFLDRQINYPMFRWFYQQVLTDRKNPYRTYLAPIEGRLTNDFYFTVANEDMLAERQNLIQSLQTMQTVSDFNADVESGDNLIGRVKADGLAAWAAINQFNRYVKLKEQMGKKFPKEFRVKDDIVHKIYPMDFKIDRDGSAFFPTELRFNNHTFDIRPTHIAIKVTAETNKAMLPKSLIKKTNEYGNILPDVYMFDPYDQDDMNYLLKMKASVLTADTEQKAYQVNYKKMQEKANSTEGQLQMDPYHIDNLLITSMSVTYENTFAKLQTQIADHPTYQFLGSQDPYLEVTFETTDREAVSRLKQLLEVSDYYSKQYRLGITSGFIGFENQLSRLFGVTTVMVETCNIFTVPGFPNRFQIQLTMCGFDKTQKRSETLDGFSATSSTNKEDRYVTSSALGNDPMIIERKMKDLELYPDLELPTYKELNDALPKIGAGVKVYGNPTGALYVDPDFYISTGWTYREYFRDFKDREKSDNDGTLGLLEIQDFAGFSGTMRVNSDKVFEADAQNMALFKSMDEKTKEAREQSTDVGTSYASQLSSVADPQLSGADYDSTTSSGAADPSIKSWVKNTQNLYTPPSLDTVASWMGWSSGNDTLNSKTYAGDQANLKAKYNAWLGKNPTTVELYAEMYKNMDELFSAYFVDDRKVSSNVVKQKITYAPIDDFANAWYLWLKNSGDKRFVNAPAVPEPSTISYKDLNQTQGRFTRERLGNYFKAMFDLENGWRQFVQKGGRWIPDKNASSTAVGIGQIMLYWHAKNKDHAQRLCWDWRFNLRFSMEYFLGHLKTAWNSSNIQLRSRPFDWAWRMYNWGSYPKNGVLKNDYYNLCAKRFDKYNSFTFKYASPNNKMDKDIYNYATGASKATVALVNNDRQAIINHLIELGDRGAAISPKVRDPEKVKEFSTQKLIDMVRAATVEIQSGPGRYVDADKWLQDYEAKQQLLQGENAEAVNSDDPTGLLLGTDFGGYNTYEKIEEAIEINRLRFEESPQETWKDMFTDLCEYDQRGRLLRAFPTFQMFIIDEGRWMASYRLWDNLYGFNAIQSIDIHKSRKIAADTAVIKMTNVYSNLTSRRMEDRYGDWSYSIWDNFIWGNPSQEILDARAEIQSQMMLQTGARIHVRMGYGSDATSLPVMFNGTITELDSEDVVTIIAQGDGIELTNIVSADPGETNDSFFTKILEPRDLLAKLLTSRGNWFKDAINYVSGGVFFKDNPLGIMHFGNPVKVPGTNAAPGAIFGWHADGSDYGEAVQNIYSSAGIPTFSQWTYQDGTSIGLSWDEFGGFIPTWGGDELDIEMKLYGMSTWDVAQTLAYTSPDYIAAVHPFEMRSTLFFGKPYYRLAYKYESEYKWDEEEQTFQRTVKKEVRKPYQQFHIYNSITDIIGNKIKASEEGIYTNVIARGANGDQSLLQQCDSDIYYDKQKTTIVDTSLVNSSVLLPKFWGVKKQLNYYAQSTLRDYMKDMYKGELIVIGDPSVKPYDLCHMTDTVHDMNGPFHVEAVTHSFSLENGFISSITPDAVVVIDDTAMIGHTSWWMSTAIGASAFMLGKYMAARSMRKLASSVSLLKGSGQWTSNAVGKALLNLTSMIDTADPDFADFKKLLKTYYSAESDAAKSGALDGLTKALDKMKGKVASSEAKGAGKVLGKLGQKGLVSISEGILNNLGKGRSAMAFLRAGGLLVRGSMGAVNIVAGLAVSYAVSTWQEAMRRNKKARQAVMIMPMKYQSRNFTAGINGQKGSVVGTKPGKMDQFYMGAGYGGQDDWTKKLGQVMNIFLDPSSDGNIFTDSGKGSVDYYINTSEIDVAWINKNK